MILSEIYEGMEGEGKNIGTFQLFVRTHGCKVRCKTCDSKYTWGAATPENSFVKTPVEVYEEYVKPCKANWISITGGDPLLQADEVSALIDLCHKDVGTYKKVNIEATGLSNVPAVFKKCNLISADIKTPNTGVLADYKTTLELYRSYLQIQFKAVVACKEDIEFLRKFGKLPVVITPCWEPGKQLDMDVLIQIQDLIKEFPQFRMIVQQHKFLYGAEKKGV